MDMVNRWGEKKSAIMVNQNISQTDRGVDVTEVSDKCSYLITANALWCSEQNYRGTIESGLYPLKPPPQVRVPRTLIIIRLLPFQWNGRSNRRQVGEVLLCSAVVASVVAIVRLLLVMSGDVEENPGPLGKGEMNMSLPNNVLSCSAVRRTCIKYLSLALTGASMIHSVDVHMLYVQQ